MLYWAICCEFDGSRAVHQMRVATDGCAQPSVFRERRRRPCIEEASRELRGLAARSGRRAIGMSSSTEPAEIAGYSPASAHHDPARRATRQRDRACRIARLARLGGWRELAISLAGLAALRPWTEIAPAASQGPSRKSNSYATIGRADCTVFAAPAAPAASPVRGGARISTSSTSIISRATQAASGCATRWSSSRHCCPRSPRASCSPLGALQAEMGLVNDATVAGQLSNNSAGGWCRLGRWRCQRISCW